MPYSSSEDHNKANSQKELTFSITSWFKGNIVIITMYKFTNVTRGKQQLQTQHNESVLHHKVCPPSQM
jgi:hypothetical protein